MGETVAAPARPRAWWPYYKRLLRFLRPHGWRMAVTIVCSFVAAALDGFALVLLIPFLNLLFGKTDVIPSRAGAVGDLLRGTVETLMDPADKMGSLFHVIIVILVVMTLKNLFVWLGGISGAMLQEYVVRDIRDAVYKHLQGLPIGWFTRTKTGQILSTVLGDTDQAKQLITQLITQSLQNLATVVTYTYYIFRISAQLSFIALLVAPALMFSLQPLLRRLRRRYRALRDQHGEMMSVLQESVSGIRLVKSFGAEGYEARRFVGASRGFSRGLVKTAKIGLLSQPITETIGTAMTVFLLWRGADLVLNKGAMDAASFLTFLTFVLRLLPPLKQLSQVRTNAQNALASTDRVFDVLDAPSEEATDRGTRDADGLRQGIAFERVSFAYADEPVLTDVSFEALRGRIVAFVGPSGAGKSTLVDLIPRFYEPTAGRVLLDGVDTRELRLPSLRRLIAMVSQETVIFNDTVRNNIAYGMSDRYTQAEIERAARAANAHEFIERLPLGYDTVLGERGTRLSGGQRQRVAIARALLVDRPVLILDEATSALDTESERLVQEAIDNLLVGRTTFVIAHRLSTIQHAHLILVLDEGRVVERGTHAELLARGGLYARLHAMQFRDGSGAGSRESGAEDGGESEEAVAVSDSRLPTPDSR